jgi:hypothetical protein
VSSLQVTDQESAAVATAPRVALTDIEAAIAARFDFRGSDVTLGIPIKQTIVAEQLGILSICILVMRNGFTVIGKSAPASPANFNRELGKQFAYEDAVRQLWPLMGFALRDRLAREG